MFHFGYNTYHATQYIINIICTRVNAEFFLFYYQNSKKINNICCAC